VPPAVEVAVTRALARSPADRFRTAAEFATALTGSSVPPSRRIVSRSTAAIGAALVGGVVVAAIVLSSQSSHGAKPILQQATSAASDPRNGPPRSIAVLPFVNLNDSAVVQCRRTIELDSTLLGPRLGLSTVYFRLGKVDQAFAELRAVAPGPDPAAVDFNINLAYLKLDALAGRPGEARDALKAMEAVGKHHYIRPDYFARAHALLGDRDEAFAWLDRAVKEPRSRRS
jgi:tetratricopeptide (TPR) repeat protein